MDYTRITRIVSLGTCVNYLSAWCTFDRVANMHHLGYVYEVPIVTYWYLGFVAVLFIGVIISGLYLYKMGCFAECNGRTCFDMDDGKIVDMEHCVETE
ncbi:hypothetical protein FGIG_06550 [Fasciola gigantica]|uniref:Uncharacterized protein n=1 Tax=Fasciola gigantica TaxID=46835 RepID=A0A504Y531_FASGI|nr:hypothetical protein FGIG_06550 [Fasciola gigantica]